MDKQGVIDLIRDAGFGILTTVDGDKPKARPMMPYLDEETGKMLLAILPHSRTIAQIQANPNIELCYIDRQMNFARVSGTAKLSDDKEGREKVWNNIPMLRQYFTGPEDSNFKLIEIETGEIEVMTPQQKEPDIVSLK
ncbi:MAG: pyridoxamine 5'-phosphate oxidase family protein [Candidatus Omnitrophica bacterium]|nr:pyridoxamine 5'-phosphate oxidase family protein [Candidatus Omnitrophota bacterium]